MSVIPKEWLDKATRAYMEAHLLDVTVGSRDAMRVALAAVLPDVRRAVGEEIAAAIEEERWNLNDWALKRISIARAASIAREKVHQ